jgi:hypothetical protein
MRLFGSAAECQFAWHSKSAHTVAYLLCHGNDCDWVDLLTEVWGDAGRDARAAYHTLQSALNKRLRELYASNDHPLSVAANRARLSLTVLPIHLNLVEAIELGDLFSLSSEAEHELRKCDPQSFLSGVDGHWANSVRKALQVSHDRLTHAKWDAVLPHSSQLHGGRVRELIEAARSDLTFVVMDANELVLSCERPLLAALHRGVNIRLLAFDVTATIKAEDSLSNVMVDEVGLSRCANGVQAIAALRKKWSGEPSRLDVRLYPWTPLSSIYIMDGGTSTGKIVIIPYVVSRQASEVPAYCLSWKAAGKACAEYVSAVNDMFASSATRELTKSVSSA